MDKSDNKTTNDRPPGFYCATCGGAKVPAETVDRINLIHSVCGGAVEPVGAPNSGTETPLVRQLRQRLEDKDQVIAQKNEEIASLRGRLTVAGIVDEPAADPEPVEAKIDSAKSKKGGK